MTVFSIRIPDFDRSFNSTGGEIDFPTGKDSDSSDMEFEFLEDGFVEGITAENSPDENENFDGEEGENGGAGNFEENKDFWENQCQVLMGVLYRTSSLESRIRNSVKDALRDIQRTGGSICACGIPAAGDCKSCLIKEVSFRLQNSGFNSAICRSKWRSSHNIPSGEHTFIDVIENSKNGEVRIIVELNFRAEFEIARASEEYNRLVEQLPEFFVGKVERLTNVIKILCSAAKKCMKEKKMHMGPWRKQRYMQAKWLSASERTRAVKILPATISGRQKARASLLTVDLRDKIPNMHFTAVEVV